MAYVKEAKSIGIKVTDDELKAEVKRLVSERGIDPASDKYPAWVSSAFGEGVSTFEDRIRDLMLINKLTELKANPEVTVTEAEMEQKFKNQNSSFESEYIFFENGAKANEFLVAVKADPKLWKETFDARKKESGQKGAAWINEMSLEAMIDLWKIPRDDALRILDGKEGDFIAAKNYYGDVVVRLLNKRKADMGAYDDKKKEYYKNMLTSRKIRRIVQDYFDDLFKRAGIKDFVAEEQRKAKIEALKRKSDIVIETNQGDIELKLFPESAPFACENFVGIVEKVYYDGLIFHRVKKDFMIQGGDPTGTGAGGESIWKEPFRDEINEKLTFDKPGVLAMANSGPDTNKSQFFITSAPAAWLNGRHTIFGELVSGMETVKKIESSPIDSTDKPKEDQKIIRMRVKTPAN